MDVTTRQLKAFLAVARCLKLSKAALELRITQPAVSQRISELEKIVGTQLFIRTRSGVRITESGRRFLQYAMNRMAIDQEYSSSNAGGQLVGRVGIAGHFSVINHVVVPAMASLLREHEGLQFNSIIKEDDEVLDMLLRSECDLIFIQKPLQDSLHNCIFMGYEEYVLIESVKYTSRRNVYLDSDSTDVLTKDFFLQQNKMAAPISYERSYFHDETGILRAVALGLGRALVAKNEISKRDPVRRVPGFKSYKLPVFLGYTVQKFYSNIINKTIDKLIKECPKYLCKK